MTSQNKQFSAHAPIQAMWLVAPCERFTLPNCRLVRGSSWMEYELVKAEGCSTDMVKWKGDSQFHKVNILEEKGNLTELGCLAEAPAEQLVNWVSRHGLLGFRPIKRRLLSHPELAHVIILGANRVHGPENEVRYQYEPLSLIKEGARIARATAALYEAIRIADVRRRENALVELIHMNPDTGVGRKDSPSEIEMRAFDVPIGLHIQPITPSDWTKVAVEGLSHLTDAYLSSEFTLYWSEAKGLRRKISCGWKVQSLFGGLFLKMVSHLRETLYCVVCGEPLNNRVRSHAKTCGVSCRQRLKRSPKKFLHTRAPQ